MKVVRWILVFLFYAVAELLSPTAVPTVEALDGEAEEALHHGARRRVASAGLIHEHPTNDRRPAAVRPSRGVPAPSPRRVSARVDAPRKVPAPVPDSASAPEDH
jgi:hypothetical protein